MTMYKETLPILTFFHKPNEPNGIFSQWYPASFIDEKGREYNCAEQYMMAEKARLFGDIAAEKKIMHVSSPREQKKLGRAVKNFNKGKWNATARQIVYRGNYLKFTQNPDLLEELLKTEGELVEASPSDKIWGIGLPSDHPDALIRRKWRGKNWLGKVLTQLRNDLRLKDRE